MPSPGSPDQPPRYEVEYLPQAVADIERAVRYVNKELASPAAARRLGEALEALVKAGDSLAAFPYRNPVYRPLLSLEHEVRWMLAERRYLFYWVDEESRTVTVARVVYARRDLSSIDPAALYPRLGG